MGTVLANFTVILTEKNGQESVLCKKKDLLYFRVFYSRRPLSTMASCSKYLSWALIYFSKVTFSKENAQNLKKKLEIKLSADW